MAKKSEKLVNEKMQEKNNKPLNLTLNSKSFPTGETFEDKEWKDFKFLVERNIKARLENIVLKMYRWTLPDELNARVIEYGFLYKGWVSIFKDPDYGHLSLGALPSFYNVYGQPTIAMVYGFNDYVKPVKINYNRPIELPATVDGWGYENTDRFGVIARDNDYGRENNPKLYIDYINEYTKTLTDLKLGMIVSSQRLKNPFVIAVKKKALGKTVNKFVKSIKNNEISVLMLDEKITQDSSVRDLIDVIDLKSDPESPKKLAELWENQFDSFLTTIGINSNPSPDKTQYVNNQELGTNNNVIDIARDVRFDNRQELCDLAKKVLDLDLSVEINVEEIEPTITNIYKEGKDNGFGTNSQTSE